MPLPARTACPAACAGARAVLAGCVLLFSGGCVQADEVSPALDRASLWLGGYYANTTLKLEAQADHGRVDTGELKLARGRDAVGRARIDLLLFDRQGLGFDWYTLGRSSSSRLTRDFTYEGVPFVLDSTMHGRLRFSAGSVAWHWWLGEGSDVLGIGLGAVWYRASLALRGTVSLEDITADGSARWSDDAVAPLLDLAWRHAFSDDLRAYVALSGVRKNGGRLSGHVHDARIGLEWFPWQRLGIGCEYGYTRVSLERRAHAYDAGLGIALDGPSLFARMRF